MHMDFQVNESSNRRVCFAAIKTDPLQCAVAAEYYIVCEDIEGDRKLMNS